MSGSRRGRLDFRAGPLFYGVPGREYLPLSGLVGAPRNPKEQLGRRGYGLEIEPMSVAVALERLASMGLKPELVS